MFGTSEEKDLRSIIIHRLPSDKLQLGINQVPLSTVCLFGSKHISYGLKAQVHNSCSRFRHMSWVKGRSQKGLFLWKEGQWNWSVYICW
jgi:hypothetical protein